MGGPLTGLENRVRVCRIASCYNGQMSDSDDTKVKMDVGERAWTQSQIFEANMEIRNRQAEEAEKVEEARRKEEWEWEEHKHTKSIGEWRKSNRLTFWAVVIAFASLATGALTFLYNYLFPNG